MNRQMPEPQPVYYARVDRETSRKKGPWLDGDTFILERLVAPPALKEGEVWVRLLEVDTPETQGETLEAGLAAAAFTRLWLERVSRDSPSWPLVLQPVKKDSFGRWLSYVWARSTGESLNDALVVAGHSSRVSAMQQLREA